MARLVGSVLAMMALIGLSQALKMSEFKSISSDKGVADEWSKDISRNVTKDDFALVYGGDKLFLISLLPNSTASNGGIVSTLINGTWTHANYKKVDVAHLPEEEIFSIGGRLFLLTMGERDNTIGFDKLFFFDESIPAWIEIKYDIPDNRSFQPVGRGALYLVNVDVPNQDDKIAYVVATDHGMAKNDSETSFSKLEVAFDDAGKPLNASLVFINRVKSPMAKAVIASVLKDKRLMGVIGSFQEGIDSVNITIDYYIDMANGNNIVKDGFKVDNSSYMAWVDYSLIKRRVFQIKDLVICLGPHTIVGDHDVRHVWGLDLSTFPQMKLDLIDANFVTLPIRVFDVDQKNMRLLTAGLVQGAYAADVAA